MQSRHLCTKTQKRAEEDLEDTYFIKNRVEKKVIPKLAKEHGALNLIAKIRKLRKQTDDAEQALKRLGFELNSNERIEFRYKPPKILQKALDAAIKTAKEKRDELPRNYRVAMVNLVAATFVEDAKKIVENLL